MTIGDAPSRETCTMRRERTNTPLLALLLLNERQYFEAARHLAAKMILEGGETPEQRATYGFRRAAVRHNSARSGRDRVLLCLCEALPAAAVLSELGQRLGLGTAHGLGDS